MNRSWLVQVIKAVPSVKPLLSDLTLHELGEIKTVDYYNRRLMTLVQERYDGERTDEEFIAAFTLLMATQLTKAFEQGAQDVGGELDTETLLELEKYKQDENEYTRNLLAAILLAIAAGVGYEAFKVRAEMWANRFLDARNRAMVMVGRRRNVMLTWHEGDTKEKCTDCVGYDGQTRTATEWDILYQVTGHKPQARGLECKGYNCRCSLDVAKP